MRRPRSGKPTAILLTHRIPYPPDKGDKIRSYRLLRYLAERYEVALGTFVDDADDWRHVAHLETLCAEVFARPLTPRVAALRSVRALATGQPITLARYADPRLAAWTGRRMTRRPALRVGFSAGVMPYLLDGAPVPVLADLCDADSAKWTAYAAEGRGPKAGVFAREGRLLAAYEAEVTRRADRTFLVTPEEAEIVRALPGADASRVDHYRNGVDTDHFAPGAVAPQPDGADVVLTGAMDYRPNAAGADWFARRVWPSVLAKHPGATFAIVGARPTQAVRALARRPGVTVTGRVPDVRPWLAAARVAVAPLGVARGVQNKVLEAMAMGTPLVASANAARGTQAVPGAHLMTADRADEMTRAVLSLLDDPARAEALARAGRDLAVTRFGWDAALARFGAALPEGPSRPR